MSNINIFGTGPDQTPTNSDLGTMAFQDQEYVNAGNLIAATVDITTEARISRFSTANARITGGIISGVSGTFTTLLATNFSSANGEITGTASHIGTTTAGAVSRVANVYANLGNFSDLTSANVQLTGTAASWMRGVAIESANIVMSGGSVGTTAAGALSRVANVYATLGNFTDLTVANALLTSGNIRAGNITGAGTSIGMDQALAINRVANVYGTYGDFDNFRSANALLISGNIRAGNITGAGTSIGMDQALAINRVANVYSTYGDFNNFSTGNAIITGAVITGTTSNIGVTNVGVVSRIANIYATFTNISNLSSANANFVSGNITSGNITGAGTSIGTIADGTVNRVATIFATAINATGLSAANVQLTGTAASWMRGVAIESANIVMSEGSIGTTAAGALSRVANVYATLGNFTNFTTANARISDSADLTKIFSPNISQTPASRISSYAMPTVSSTGNGSSLVGTYWRYAANVSYTAQTTTTVFDLLGPTNGTPIVIEGGAMGTQGALRCRVFGNILNTVTATNTSNIQVCFGTANLVIGLSPQLAANAAPRAFLLDFTINNLNSTSVQTIYGTYFIGPPGGFNSVGSSTQAALISTPFGFTAAQNTAANVNLRVMGAQNGTTAGMTTTVNYASIQLLHH